MKTNRVREYTVADFMSKNVLTIDADSKASKTVETMVYHDVGSIVVTKDEHPLGIFTERDLLKILVKDKRPDGVVVREFTSPGLAKVSPDLRSREAAAAMTEKKGRLLVFEQEKLVGIVTATDILKAIYRIGRQFDISKVISKKVAMTDSNTPVKYVIQQMDAKGVGSVVITRNKVAYAIFTERDLLNKVLYTGMPLETAVGDVSTLPLVTAQLGISGGEVVGAMVSRRIKRLPLTQKGEIVGIITARDIVEAYANLPDETEEEIIAKQIKVRYGELCPICNSRIDDHGLCGCGAGGE